jgi:pimeloyl-ACP methyl ester carboxylesterase
MPHHRHVHVNGVDLRIAEQGEGPLVVLLHGFPETSFSWRHQLDALAAAGYHVVAPDQRGYGGSSRPDGIDAYTIFHVVGDVVALVRSLGASDAVVVGHDWGSAVAWNTALMRPDVVRGVVGVSVPPLPRGPLPPLTVARERFGEGFYQIYFQEPGVADVALGKDVEATLRSIYGSEGGTPWFTEDELATFVGAFTETGFTGPLNWYRNIDRNWELMAPWQDARITPPSLYISGEKDIVRTFYAMDDTARALVPNLRGVVDVPDCGHWTQQERPDVVTNALLSFLRDL